MPTNAQQVSDYLNFALLQLGAESYLHDLPEDTQSAAYRNRVIERWKFGFNDPTHPFIQQRAGAAGADAPILPGYNRMVESQASALFDKYEIVDHHANDATGFAATLYRNKQTGEYILSPRSTEFRSWAKAGDQQRDNLGANLEGVLGRGFALAQLASLEDYYASLKATGGKLEGVAQITVTGYSLSGHLATVFTLMHETEIAHAYVYNSAGHGVLADGSGAEIADATNGTNLRAMLALFSEGLRNPLGAVVDAGNATLSSLATLARQAYSNDPSWNPFVSENGLINTDATPRSNVYQHIRYLFALAYVSQQYPTRSLTVDPVKFFFDEILSLKSNAAAFEMALAEIGKRGEVAAGSQSRDGSGYGKITQLFGAATHDDYQLVSNSQRHTSNLIPIVIEDQQDVYGNGGLFGDGLGDFGTSHALILQIDTLSLVYNIQQLISSATLEGITPLIAAASNQRATSDLSYGFGLFRSQARSEGNSLENLLDGLRNALYTQAEIADKFSQSNPFITPFNNQKDGFGNFDNRTLYYEHLADLLAQGKTKSDLALKPLVEEKAGSSPQFSDIDVGRYQVLSATEIEELAKADTLEGMAVRYALEYGNAFALSGGGLYADYRQGGPRAEQLDRYDQATGAGAITEAWIKSRSELLERRLLVNLHNLNNDVDNPVNVHLPADPTKHAATRTLAQDNVVFEDRGLDYRLDFGAKNGHRRVVFGKDAADAMEGGAGDDHLFGESGGDNLLANAGKDYLEGGAGDDVLSGGEGDDTLFGGKDNDVLRGGLGEDTYIIGRKAGTDEIIDFAPRLGGILQRVEKGDGKGKIEWAGQDISGTKRQIDVNDPKNFEDGNGFRYEFTGKKDSRGKLTIYRTDGDTSKVEIQSFKSGELGITLNFEDPPPKPVQVGTEDPDGLSAEVPRQKVFGRGGDDSILVSLWQAEGWGGAGNDYIANDEGDQYLYGEEGEDFLNASGGNDELYGGDDNDAMKGGRDSDYLSGGDGEDIGSGGGGSDVIEGGEGNDFLFGDYLVPFGDAPFGTALTVDASAERWSVEHFEPEDGKREYVIKGVLVDVEGPEGNDVIDGGAGNDHVWAGGGNDLVLGEDGDDRLSGDGGGDTMFGGAGKDLLLGDGSLVEEDNFLYVKPEDHGNDFLDGEGGDDEIQGQGGNDTLYGGSGDDLLEGDAGDTEKLDPKWHGADYLDGGDGKDRLFGDGGDDTLFGGAGDDELSGDAHQLDGRHHGKDTLDGGEGDDILVGFGGDDKLFGGDGKDQLAGDYDSLDTAYHGKDYLDGGKGDDVLQGQGGDDRLFGGEGKDQLEGGTGDDQLTGGIGNDILDGGEGKDTYAFATGDGTDTLYDGDTGNIIRFGDGVSADGLIAFKNGSAPDFLGLRFGAEDTVAVQNGMGGTVEQFEFADGSVLSLRLLLNRSFKSPTTTTGTAGADRAYGGAGADRVVTYTGDDRLTGGAGADFLEGGGGDDVYVYGTGDGGDIILDIAGNDAIAFIDGIGAADLVFQTDTRSLRIQFKVGTDGITLSGAVADTELRVEELRFEDGTVITFDEMLAQAVSVPSLGGVLMGTMGNDTLTGGGGKDYLIALDGDDTLNGAGGDDLLDGGAGADTYHFSEGHDQIDDADLTATVVDRLVMGPGSSSLTSGVGVDPTDGRLLVFKDSASGDFVKLPNTIVESDLERLVERIEFADGTIWTPSDLLDRAQWSWVGTSGADTFEGTDVNDTAIGQYGDDTISGGKRRDRLYGGSGDDVLDGGAGDDYLDGGTGRDTLIGGDGFDSLYGNAGENVFRGGRGNDLMVGSQTDHDVYYYNLGDGRDVIVDRALPYAPNRVVFGAGITVADISADFTLLSIGTGGDTLELRSGILGATGAAAVSEFQFADGTVLRFDELNQGLGSPGGTGTPTPGGDDILGTNAGDTIDALAGDDIVLGNGGNDTLRGGEGRDDLRGNAGDDALFGDAGDDVLSGDAGADTLQGGTGTDMLIGGAGADTLDGGADDDVLQGGAGSDIYLFGRGSGLDVIMAAGNIVGDADTVCFGAGVAPDDLDIVRDLRDVYVTIKGTADRLRIADWGAGRDHRIARFEFADGTAWTGDELLSRSRYGHPGVIAIGTPEADTLSGFNDDDMVYAGAGSDVVYTSAGDDLIYGEEGDDLLYADAGNDRIFGGDGVDALEAGVGDDLLDGGASPDTLSGGAGNDTYVFGHGYGTDVVIENDATPGNRDIIALAPGILPADVTLTRDAQSVFLTVGPGTADRLTLTDWMLSEGNRVEAIRFADGTEWNAAEILARAAVLPPQGRTIIGTPFDDTLFGGPGADTINAAGGTDAVYAGEGADTIDGGAGDDYLDGGDGADVFDDAAGNDFIIGGAGGDTFRFGRGYGADIIANDNAADAEVDTIQFLAGVTPAQVTRTRSLNDLVLSINGTPDSITVSGWFLTADLRVDQVMFADGTVWTESFITGSFPPPTPTAGNDSLKGTAGNDTVDALAGNDVVDGLAGNDTLRGNTGDDQLLGNAGNDTLDGGAGFDWLYGGEGDDALNGGSDTDVLLGDAGNDTFTIARGAGNDVVNEYGGLETDLDTLRLTGVTSTQVTLERDYHELRIRINGATQTITLSGVYDGKAQEIEQIVFDAGVTWTFAEATARAAFVPPPGDFITGTGGIDYLTGGEGADTIRLLDGDDYAEGGRGNDLLEGGRGIDTLLGGGEDDTLDGGEGGTSGFIIGGDWLEGGTGNDTYLVRVSTDRDTIVENDPTPGNHDVLWLTANLQSTDVFLRRAGDDLNVLFYDPVSPYGQVTLRDWWLDDAHKVEAIRFDDGTTWNVASILAVFGTATEGSDQIEGTSGDDNIDALGGADEISGHGGNDILSGGTGLDTLTGGDGDDQLLGGADADTLRGDAGGDLLDGGAGFDFLYAGAGSDHLFGGADGDTLYGEAGDDLLDGGAGSDTLTGGAGADRYVFGRGYGADTVQDGGPAGDFDEVLFNADVAAGDLQLTRESGNLIVRINGTTDRLTFSGWYSPGEAGIDRFRFSDGVEWNVAQIEAAVTIAAATTGNDNILGSNAADTLDGLAGNDTLSGEGGDDTLLGNSGNDILRGGAGNDTLSGGPGNDFLEGGTGDDAYVLERGTGADVAFESETLTEGGSSQVSTGNDYVRVGAGVRPEDVVVSRSGDSLVLSIEGGDDSLTLPKWFESGGYLIEEVRFEDGTVWDGAELVARTTVPTTSDDTLIGSDLDDTIEGGAGKDSIRGAAGNDHLIGGSGNDKLEGDAGNDTLDGGSDADSLFGGDGDDLMRGETGSDGLDGDAGDDVLSGGSGGDGLAGGSGNDVLDGGKGNDALYGGEGDDVYLFARGDGRDTLYDSEGSNRIRFSPGVAPADLSLALDGDDLLVELKLTGDALRFPDWVVAGQPALPRLEFADGTIWNVDTDTARLYLLNNPFEVPPVNNFFLTSGGGEIDTGVSDPAGAFIDQLVLDNDVTPERLIVQRVGEHLRFAIEDTSDSILFGYWFQDASHRLDAVRFVDGTVWDRQEIGSRLLVPQGTPGRDIILGGDGNDTIDGRGGADDLAGGDGDDTLIGGADTSGPGGFEGGARPFSEYRLTIPERAHDVLDGGRGNDYLIGSPARDVLYGGLGDDVLDGAGGADWLMGAEGSDTYLISIESGTLDRIRETAEGFGEGNRVLFGDGIAPDALTIKLGTALQFRAVENEQAGGPYNPLDLVIGFHSSGGTPWGGAHDVGQLMVGFGEWFGAIDLPLALAFGADIDRFIVEDGILDRIQFYEFADGTVWTSAQMLEYAARTTEGTEQADTVAGGFGTDYLYGEAGDDTLIGNESGDELYGGTGNDALEGGSGVDYLWGGEGDDVLDGGINSDYLFGGAGVDRLYGGLGNDWLQGDAGHDVLAGNEGDDRLDGGDGNDVLDGGDGDDHLQGDTLHTRPGALAGITDYWTLAGEDVLDGGAGNDTLHGLDGADVLLGGAGDDVLWGGNEGDLLFGGEGRDNLLSDAGGPAGTTRGGDDLLDGGSDADRMEGGIGSDTYVVDDAGDQVIERATAFGVQEGIDHVRSAIDYTLTANVENLTLTGDTGLRGTGNGLNNMIRGNAAANRLEGMGGDDVLDGDVGADTMDGGVGNDTFVVDDAGDAILEGADQGTDTVRSSVTFTLAANVENLTLTGATAIDGTGNALDNVFRGNAAANQFAGGDGSDTYHFDRGAGQDTVEDFSLLAGSIDVVEVAEGVAPAQLSAHRLGSDLQLRIAGAADTLTLRNWFVDTAAKVEQVRFSDGTTWDVAYLEAHASEPGGNAPPQVSAPLPDATVDEDAALSYVIAPAAFTDPGDPLTYSARAADGAALPAWLNFDPATRTFTGTPGNAEVGTVSLRVTATDTGGLSASDVFDLTVANTNDAPVLATPLADQSATEDAPFVFTVPTGAFIDVDAGDTLGLSATLADGSALPGWLTLNAGARTLSGTPANADLGTLSVKITATDVAGTTASDTFELTVANTNDAPIVATPVADQTTAEDAAFALVIPASVFADVDAGDTLSYAASLGDGSALPGWLSFSAGTRTFGGRPENGDVGTFTVKLTATDNAGAVAADAFDLAVTNVNDAPVLATAIADQSAIEDAAFSFTVPLATFTDVDAGDTLAYAATRDDGSALPAWLTFNPVTRSFTGTPANGDVGGFTIRLVATDAAGATAADSFNLSVANVNDAPVLAVAVADQSAVAGTGFSFQFSAGTFSDTDAGDGLSYTAALVAGGTLPAWLAFNAAARSFEGTPAPADAGELQIRLTATDGSGATATDEFKLTVQAPPSGVTLIGTAGNDALTGGMGDDTLDGLGGADLLTGSGGDDTFLYARDAAWTGGFVARNVGSPGNPGTNRNAAIAGKQRSYDVFLGGAGTDTLQGTASDDAIFLDDLYSPFHAGFKGARLDSIERIVTGEGSDVVDLTSTLYAYGDVTVEGGAGNDVLWASSGSDALFGEAGNDELFGGAGSDFLAGGEGNDTLNGDRGNDLLEGDGGNDTLSDSAGANLLYAGAGNDSLTGGAGNELLIGGAGNDTLTVGSGRDLVAFNRGDGLDTVTTTSQTGTGTTLSLGGGIGYGDLSLKRTGNHLVLETGAGESLTLQNWYAGANRRGVDRLQVVAEAMAGFDQSGADPLKDDRIETFDFRALVQKFDQARAANPAMNRWAVTDAFLSAHLGGSDTEAMGGDLAYRYGLSGSLAGIGTGPAQGLLADSRFGSAAQELQPLAGLQEGLVRLG